MNVTLMSPGQHQSHIHPLLSETVSLAGRWIVGGPT
jgi:hypothetical protein